MIHDVPKSICNSGHSSSSSSSSNSSTRVSVTGRASQRLKETSGQGATTIHRLLKWVPSKFEANHLSDSGTSSDADDRLLGSGQFLFNKHNPLAVGDEFVDVEQWQQVDAVLLDEGSMLDLPLAAALLEALPRNCQLVFVGQSVVSCSLSPSLLLYLAVALFLICLQCVVAFQCSTSRP